MPGSGEGGQLIASVPVWCSKELPSPAAETATSPTRGRGDKPGPVVWISMSGLLRVGEVVERAADSFFVGLVLAFAGLVSAAVEPAKFDF